MRVFKKTICFLTIFIFALIGTTSAQFSGFGTGEKKEVYFKNNSFVVEVARTKRAHEEGLMFVKSMPPNSGMLFVYNDEGIRSFYMKNMYISIDIIWMDKDKRVVFIKKNAKPASLDSYEIIQPEKEAMYVLELNAGNAEKIGLSIGDVLKF